MLIEIDEGSAAAVLPVRDPLTLAQAKIETLRQLDDTGVAPDRERFRSTATRAIRRAPGSRGSRSNNPSTSDSSSTASAPAACAMRAASRSLSPKRISSVATLSFSFTTGTAPAASRRPSVAETLR